MAAKGDNKGVQVLVRVRPMLHRELQFNHAVEVVSDRRVKLYKNGAEFNSVYDYVFPEEATQEDVFSRVRGSIVAAAEGYNSTVFAYGQTGTGKTHTMMGEHGNSDLDGGGSSGNNGIIPRAVRELFQVAKARQDQGGAAIQVVLSFLEIYKDRCIDLLQPYKQLGTSRVPGDIVSHKALLAVREEKDGSVFVPNLLCVKCKSYRSVLQLIATGNRNRVVRHTEMNTHSSRSHAVLQIVLEQWPGGGMEGTVVRSKVNFVDLAGSERWKKGVVMEQSRKGELTAINSSLSALASVVAALTDRLKHVPYRDSKLTHLLQDSLGGNCRTTIIATLSPSGDSFDESCSTLKFADRARNIGNNPVVNTSRDIGSVLALKEKEIVRLRALLATYAAGGGPDAAAAGLAPTTPLGDGLTTISRTEAAAALQVELDEMRLALEMERALRAQLEIQLHRTMSFPGGPPSPMGSVPPRVPNSGASASQLELTDQLLNASSQPHGPASPAGPSTNAGGRPPVVHATHMRAWPEEQAAVRTGGRGDVDDDVRLATPPHALEAPSPAASGSGRGRGGGNSLSSPQRVNGSPQRAGRARGDLNGSRSAATVGSSGGWMQQRRVSYDELQELEEARGSQSPGKGLVRRAASHGRALQPRRASPGSTTHGQQPLSPASLPPLSPLSSIEHARHAYSSRSGGGGSGSGGASWSPQRHRPHSGASPKRTAQPRRPGGSSGGGGSGGSGGGGGFGAHVAANRGHVPPHPLLVPPSLPLTPPQALRQSSSAQASPYSPRRAPVGPGKTGGTAAGRQPGSAAEAAPLPCDPMSNTVRELPPARNHSHLPPVEGEVSELPPLEGELSERDGWGATPALSPGTLHTPLSPLSPHGAAQAPSSTTHPSSGSAAAEQGGGGGGGGERLNGGSSDGSYSGARRLSPVSAPYTLPSPPPPAPAAAAPRGWGRSALLGAASAPLPTPAPPPPPPSNDLAPVSEPLLTPSALSPEPPNGLEAQTVGSLTRPASSGRLSRLSEASHDELRDDMQPLVVKESSAALVSELP